MNDEPRASLPPPRFQFSLRKALLLTPALVALGFLHIRSLSIGVAADGILFGGTALIFGLRWLRSDKPDQARAGFHLTAVGVLFLLTAVYLLLVALGVVEAPK